MDNRNGTLPKIKVGDDDTDNTIFALEDEVDALGIAAPHQPVNLAPPLANDTFPPPQSRRRRRTQRQRTVPDAAVQRREYIRSSIVNLFFILAWYVFATLLSLYNKWMFSPDHLNFPFPLFVTSTHMIMQFLMAGLTMSLIPSLRPKQLPSFKDYVGKAIPCGISTGLDIGLSNASLQTITLSFYTMCKSSSLGFVLLFAFLFRLEKPTWSLFGIISLISIGVFLMVMTETKFQLVGFVEVISASALGGLRWSLTQILLGREKMGMNNPIATAFMLAPIMCVTLSVCAALVEGYGNVFSSHFFYGVEILKTMGLISLPGVIAFFMVLSEFNLLQRTSVVTLSIAGIFKEVATIFLSSLIFGDELQVVNGIGLAVTLFGIALYNYLKYKQMTNASRQRTTWEEIDEEEDLLSGGESDADAQELHADMDLVKRDSDEEDYYMHRRPSVAFYNQALASTSILDPGAKFTSTMDYSSDEEEEMGMPLHRRG